MPDGSEPTTGKKLVHLAPEAGDLEAASLELSTADAIIDTVVEYLVNSNSHNLDDNWRELLMCAADRIRVAKAIIDAGRDD